MAKTKSKSATHNPKNTWKYDLKKNGALYLIFLIPFTFLLIFKYIPMVGILMAFQDYKVAKGLFGSPWVGLDKFKELFAGAQFGYAFQYGLYGTFESDTGIYHSCYFGTSDQSGQK